MRLADQYEPSADLFEKVQRSIDEDRAHRARVRRILGWVALGLLVVVVVVALTARIEGGRVTMRFVVLEGLVSAIMVALVVVMGPAIRRFGKTYERAVFHAAPETGVRFLRLLDIAYYLVFTGYVLVTMRFEPMPEWGSALRLDGLIKVELERLSGLLLVMGLLHVLLLLTLPVVGLVVSANERRVRRGRLGPAAPPPDRVAERVDSVVTIAAWVIGVLVALQLAGIVINLVLVGMSGP